MPTLPLLSIDWLTRCWPRTIPNEFAKQAIDSLHRPIRMMCFISDMEGYSSPQTGRFLQGRYAWTSQGSNDEVYTFTPCLFEMDGVSKGEPIEMSGLVLFRIWVPGSLSSSSTLRMLRANLSSLSIPSEHR